jgi:hypothetical protein
VIRSAFAEDAVGDGCQDEKSDDSDGDDVEEERRLGPLQTPNRRFAQIVRYLAIQIHLKVVLTLRQVADLLSQTRLHSLQLTTRLRRHLRITQVILQLSQFQVVIHRTGRHFGQQFDVAGHCNKSIAPVIVTVIVI